MSDSTSFRIRRSRPEDADAIAEIQPLAFPPPFNPDYHWDPDSLRAHIRNYPQGQFVAVVGDRIVGSSSNVPISEERWAAHRDQGDHPYRVSFSGITEEETTLYGADIAVHPEFRRQGIGRAFYAARFELVQREGLRRYGTETRLPDFSNSGVSDPKEYARLVVEGALNDRTLTPLLKMGLRFLGVVPSAWPDSESGNSGAILEWLNPDVHVYVGAQG